MRLQGQLTFGWHDDPAAPLAAKRLHAMATRSSTGYASELAAALCTANGDRQVLGLERLFRRCTGGFEPLKRFVATLASLPPPFGSPQPLVCQIDAFAYAFLRQAKNFDFLLPIGDDVNSAFRYTHRAWLQTLGALEQFERVGKPLASNDGISAAQYLALRGIIARPSARDERRALATLLVSGPSTLEAISQDLGLNYSLGPRILASFEETGVIERRPPGEIFAIVDAALPLAAFVVRETLGLDLLSVLPNED